MLLFAAALASGCSGAEPGELSLANDATPSAEAPAGVLSDSTPGPPPRFVLTADGTPRLELLNSLAASEGFSLSGPTDGLGAATASIEGEQVEAVLAALLHDVPFSLHYRVAADGPLVQLGEVELWPAYRGEGASPLASEARAPERAAAEARARHRDAAAALAARISRAVPASAGELEARRDRVRGSEALAREEALLNLESEDALKRQAGISALDPANRSDARRLGDLALHDPDPGVRLEAVERISFGDPVDAIPILTQAALDPDESVATPAADELDHAIGLTTDED